MQLRMWKAAGTLVCAGMFWAGAACPARGQASVPQQSITNELRGMAAQAGTVFVGQITSIQRRGGVVEVTFRVEQAVAGAVAASYTLREWAGMWPPGHNRYVLGQRVLAFLHGGSSAGFSSPVHGAEGLVPVVVQGLDAPELVDIRRVAASVVRAPGTPLPTEAEAALELKDVLAVIRPTVSAGKVQPVRLPLPVRSRPPVNATHATFDTQSGAGLGVGSGTNTGSGVR